MKKITLYLLTMFLAWGAHPQTLGIARTEAPQEVPFAKPFVATLEVTHPEGESVTLLPQSVSPDFTVAQANVQPISPTATQVQLKLLPFTLEKSTFTASFALTANPEVTTPVEIALTVTPVQLFKDNDFKEIRPPHRPFDWALWLCILLALVALVCFIIWWVRRMKQQEVRLSTPMDNRPAHVIALSQLDALVDSGLWENKQYKVFYITLTDILRTYLYRAFGLDVSADTSAELLRHLKTKPQLGSFMHALRAFLASGDLVKFAKFIPDEQTRNTDITVLREFITQTAPKPAPAQPEEVKP